MTRFLLPKSAPPYCIGCLKCMYEGEAYCPHAEKVQPIAAALDEADLIVFASPCYVMNMSGQMKALMDHMGYRYMSHRPEPSMFRKQGLVLSTAAGAGTGKTTKAIAENLFFWGVAKIHRYGISVRAADFEHIPDRRIRKIQRKINRIIDKIKKNIGRAKPGIKAKLMFSIMKLNQKKNDWNPTYREHWIRHGWLER